MPAWPACSAATRGGSRQVLSNLVGNAIKFTARGEVVVEVRDSRRRPTTTSRCASVVRDTGVGIEADALDRIFDAFTQADGSTTRRYGGTGLGLTISRQLVRMMGGEIGVSSQRGQRLALLVHRAAAQVRAAPPPASTPQLAGRRVLVVDDSPTNREILQHQLAAGGMAVHSAASGAEALSMLRSAAVPYDLAILDVQHAGLRRPRAGRDESAPSAASIRCDW